MPLGPNKTQVLKISPKKTKYTNGLKQGPIRLNFAEKSSQTRPNILKRSPNKAKLKKSSLNEAKSEVGPNKTQI